MIEMWKSISANGQLSRGNPKAHGVGSWVVRFAHVPLGFGTGTTCCVIPPPVASGPIAPCPPHMRFPTVSYLALSR